MLDFSFGELVLVAFVALVVVGPKDLPVVMRILGRWAGQCRGVLDEFRQGFRSAMQESSLEEMGKDIHGLEQEIRFIRDEQGNLQRTYDISSFLTERDTISAEQLPEK